MPRLNEEDKINYGLPAAYSKQQNCSNPRRIVDAYVICSCANISGHTPSRLQQAIYTGTDLDSLCPRRSH
jgi:hypothetical protein